MTTHEKSRCVHCGCKYYYQGSGYGCLEELNDPKYCRDCKKAIVDALENVPIRFEFRYVDIKTLGSEYQYITKEKILEWNHACETGESGKRWCRRICMPLFDIEDPSNLENSIVITVPEGQFKGSDVEYHCWSKKPEWDNIRVKVEWDLIEDKLVNGKLSTL
jgi:hypothetical protein